MKNFFSSLLGTLAGFLIAGMVMGGGFLIFILILVAAGSDREVKIKPNSVVRIDLSGKIQDRAEEYAMPNIIYNTPPAQGLNNILTAIEHAKDNPKIKGIYLDLGMVACGVGSLEEIRAALLDFKESGKFIYAHSDFYTQKAYYLASVADKLYLTPTGGIDFRGLSAEVLFFKGLLKKAGLTPHVIRHGEFKSAVEPFLLEKMSPENREQITAYIGSIWDYMLKEIATSREISPDSLNGMVNSFVGFNADSAVSSDLVDALKYKDELLAEIRAELGLGSNKDINFVDLRDIKLPYKNKKKKRTKNQIAVIYATGSIVNGRSYEGDIIASETFAEAIRSARKDKHVKAIVLRINSGGGSALASEVIWREMSLAKEKKPVIVSMGDVAASGGYYIACNADAVLANPTTITGSIGVFGLLFSGKNLLNNKLGITTDVVKTNTYSDLASFSRPLRNDEYALIKNSIEGVYDTFISRVADGRGVTKESVDSIGQGRVWSGINALENGLIDKYGGLNDAIDLAAEKAGIGNYRIQTLPERPDPIQEFFMRFSAKIEVEDIETALDVDLQSVKEIDLLVKNQGVQMRMPYAIEVR